MSEEKVQLPAESAEDSALAGAVEEQLKKDKARRFRKGDRVRGRVYKITEAMALVDLGGRTDGMIDLADLRRSDGTLDLEEGQQVEGIVLDVAPNGLFLKRAVVSQDETVQQLRAAMEAGLPMPAKVTGFNKGGLELELFDLRAFCPASQVEAKKVDDLSPYVGQTLQFKLQEISPDGRKIVLSRRALLGEEHEKEVAAAKAKITVGATLHGKVVRVQPFGAFVDLGHGIEGLCHVSELTRARAHDATQLVKPGDELEVTVLEIKEAPDKHGKSVERIALTHKAFEKDPWEGVGERFKVGEKVPGKVARLTDFGAFVELAPGVDGLAHISALADKRIEHPRDAVKEGDSVEAWILKLEPEQKRISLSLVEPKKAEAKAERKPRPQGERPPGERPRRPRAEAAKTEAAPGEAKPEKPHYKPGQVHDGTVEKVEPFGVFVALPGGGRALVPNSELGVVKNADQKIDFRKVFPVGTAIRIALTEAGGRGLKGSVVEAQRADERQMVREWSKGQKQEGGGRQGFGTFGDLLRKANLVK